MQVPGNRLALRKLQSLCFEVLRVLFPGFCCLILVPRDLEMATVFSP